MCSQQVVTQVDTKRRDLLLGSAAVAAGVSISKPGLAAEPKSAVNPASHNPK
jgi:hypothetical protein